MAKILKREEKVLYSDGDEKWGSELVFVARRETTPSSDTSPKTVTCVKYKTLCDALKELAAFEKQKGTKIFVKEILDREQLLRGELVINHNPILGGGDSNDKTIEKTEFKNPRLPYFVDIEYVEVGYALTRQKMDAKMGMILWNWIAKPLGKSAQYGKSGNGGVGGTGITHRPNALGLQIGELIAKRYKDIAHFSEEFCRDECAALAR